MNRVPLRYPRTLGEAFKDASYADPIERPARTPYPRILWIALAIGFIAALLAARAT